MELSRRWSKCPEDFKVAAAIWHTFTTLTAANSAVRIQLVNGVKAQAIQLLNVCRRYLDIQFLETREII